MYKNKNNNKDVYILIIKAISEYIKNHEEAYFVQLYRSKENGLADISPKIITDVVFQQRDEGLYNVVQTPLVYDFLPNDSGVLLTETNYFLLSLNDNFYKLASTYDAPKDLLYIIPEGKKYKHLRKLANLLIQKGEVSNYSLAICFNSKLSKNEYYKNIRKNDLYNNKIKNCFRTLNKIYRNYEYNISFQRNASIITKIKSDIPLASKNPLQSWA